MQTWNIQLKYTCVPYMFVFPPRSQQRVLIEGDWWRIHTVNKTNFTVRALRFTPDLDKLLRNARRIRRKKRNNHEEINSPITPCSAYSTRSTDKYGILEIQNSSAFTR